MPSRGFMRDYSTIFRSIKADEQLALTLNEMARCTALKLIQKAITQGKIERTSSGEEWHQLSQGLLKT